MNTYVYEYKDNLYFNLTNKCSNHCAFCIRQKNDGELYEKGLWLANEPKFSDVIEQIPQELSKYNGFVFCGYGEPTCNLDMLIKIATYLKKYNKIIRLNTNGQGNLINKTNIIPKLADCIDVVSVSLNASDAEKYNEICKSIFGNDAYKELLNFCKECKQAGITTKVTIVDNIGADEIIKCKALCKENELDLDIRKFED